MRSNVKKLGLVLTCAVLMAVLFSTFGAVSVQGQSGTVVYVDGTDGSDDSGCGTGTGSAACETIQYAIGEASSGDTVSVAAGTYLEDINVDKDVTVTGVNAPDSVDAAVINGRVAVEVDGATVNSLKISNTGGSGEQEAIFVGNPAGYTDVSTKTIEISENIIDGVDTTADNVAVEGIHVKSYDGQQIDGVEIISNTIRNVSQPDWGSNGIKLQADLNSIEIRGNKIESIAGYWSYGVVATSSSLEPGYPKNVVIEYNDFSTITASPNADWAVAVGVDTLSGDPESGTIADASQLTVHFNNFVNTAYGAINKDQDEVLDATYNWWGDVSGPGDEGPGTGSKVSVGVLYCPWLRQSYPDGNPTDLYVDDDWAGSTCMEEVDSGKFFGLNAFAVIRDAIDAPVANDGDTVHVAAGTYVEQVEITKSLILQGAGTATVIQSPDTLTKKFTTSGDNYPIVYVHDKSDVKIQDLVVDGAGKGSGNYRFQGIGFHNAGGTVDNVEIKGVRDTPFSGSQHGVALYLYNEDGTARDITVSHCDIYDFQKNALALNASDTTPLTVDVHDNVITGHGATDVTAQNGIQIYAMLGEGTVADNVVKGIAYDDTGWVASSILNYYATLDVVGNAVSEGHVGLYNYDAAANIRDNALDIEKAGGSAYGVIATDPPEAVPSPFDKDISGVQNLGGMWIQQDASSTLTVTVSHNAIVLNSGSYTGTSGISAYAGYSDEDMDVSIESNLITGFEIGLFVYQSSDKSGKFTDFVVRHNSISGNQIGLGVWNVGYLTIDADNNWWGCNEGPGSSGCDTVTGTVSADPWLVLDLTADPMTVFADGGTADLLASLTENSAGDDTSAQGTVPDGITTTFAADLGSVSPVVTGTLDGEAASLYTAPANPVGEVVSATVHNETVTLTLTIDQVDLQLSKSDGVDVAQGGDTFTYTLTITNAGGIDATGVVVTDTLPQSVAFKSASDNGAEASGVVTWPAFDLAAGETVTRTVTVAVHESLPAGVDTLTNKAEVADDGTQGPDANPDDNTAEVETALTAAPVLQLTMTDHGTSVEPGGTLTYTLTYTNAGNQDATDVVITSTVPAHTTFAADASDDGWSCSDDPSGTVCTYTVGSLVAGESGEVNFAVLVDDPLPEDVEFIEAWASIGDDQEPERDEDSVDTVISQPGHTVYLPLVAHNYVVAPDLIVEAVDVGATTEVVIANIGNAPVETSFWVDLYVNPTSEPQGVNDVWSELADEGLVWGVTDPLGVGEQLTLTVESSYYSEAYSFISDTLTADDTIYVQVDSASVGREYGGVLESHEILGGDYNNIWPQGTADNASTQAASGSVDDRSASPHRLPARP